MATTTRIQTADLFLPTCVQPMQIIMERPVLPKELWDQAVTEDRVIGVRQKDSRILLFPEGDIKVYRCDGSYVKFPACPMLSDVVRDAGSSIFAQFCGDGSVYLTESGINYYFSKPFPATPLPVGPSDVFYGRVRADNYEVRTRDLAF